MQNDYGRKFPSLFWGAMNLADGLAVKIEFRRLGANFCARCSEHADARKRGCEPSNPHSCRRRSGGCSDKPGVVKQKRFHCRNDRTFIAEPAVAIASEVQRKYPPGQ